MYSTLLDFNLWIKVLFITFTHKTEVLQSDFPGFAFSFLLPKLIFGTFTSISEHNVEYIRLEDTFSLSLLGKVISRNLEKFICIFVDIIITVSSVDRDNLIKLGIKKDKVFIIPSGVDVARFEGIDADEIKKIYGIKGSVLIFHGSLQYKPNKTAVEIISKQILPRLRQKGVHVKFLIVGSSPPIEYSDEDIIFTGVVDEEDLPKHIMAADLAVVPLLAGGGTRLKILEYFAAKKPVISTSKGAEGLNVTNGKEIVIEDDLDKFINEIIYLINSRDRQERLANNAYEFVKQYDWKNLSLEYISLYKRRYVFK
jgi:glycosyltransferase involved in cell wall biosynthesis